MVKSIQKLTETVDRLVNLLERRLEVPVLPDSRYPVRSTDDDEVVDELAMAKLLDIPTRTLARYRREGRTPGCWLKNGRRIRWHVAPTLEAWQRGIG